MIRNLLASALFLLAGSASAETLVWRFDFFTPPNHSYLWGWLGDDFGPFTGEIVSTRVVFSDYIVEGNVDTADFRFVFDVPVDSQTSHIALLGTDMGWSGAGPVSYEMTTDAYNGTIRGGRFGAEVTPCLEVPCGGMGSFREGYIEFTVEGLRADPIFTSNFDDIW